MVHATLDLFPTACADVKDARLKMTDCQTRKQAESEAAQWCSENGYTAEHNIWCDMDEDGTWYCRASLNS